MSYRSDVALAIEGKTFQELINSKDSDDIQAVLTWADDTIVNDNGNHLFVWNSISWDDWKNPINNFIQSLKMIEDQSSYLFLELGQSANEPNELGCWHDNDFDLGFTRSLSFTIGNL